MYKVSVIIPSYNAELYIKAAVESVLQQTYDNIEIIVVDDGSTDQTYEIARQIESPNLTVVKQVNRGACNARNYGFELSKGDYIQFLDADDLLSPNKIEDQINLFKKYGNNIIASCEWGAFSNSIQNAQFPPRNIYKDYSNPLEILWDMWSTRSMLVTSVWLTPRHIIENAGKWDESLLINQDGEYFSRVISKVAEIKYSSSAKIYYRVGLPNSVSRAAGNKNKAISLLKSYDLYYDSYCGISDYKVRYALAVNYFSFIYMYYHLYPDLISQAFAKIKVLDIDPPLGVVGGKKFELFAPIIGFMNVLKIRMFIYRVVKMFRAA